MYDLLYIFYVIFLACIQQNGMSHLKKKR